MALYNEDYISQHYLHLFWALGIKSQDYLTPPGMLSYDLSRGFHFPPFYRLGHFCTTRADTLWRIPREGSWECMVLKSNHKVEGFKV